MSESIRSFIAVKLNDEAHKAVTQAQTCLKQTGCDVKWVAPNNIHLTLKFLGQVPLDKIDTVKGVLNHCLQSTESIETVLTGLGVFPRPQRPRVIWVGLEDKERKIQQLADLIETSLNKIGFPKEDRAFKSHITIGRVRSLKNVKQLTQTMGKYPLPLGIKQTIEQITFFKSTLTSTGPIYEVLSETKLK